jgi:hypothetical protein
MGSYGVKSSRAVPGRGVVTRRTGAAGSLAGGVTPRGIGGPPEVAGRLPNRGDFCDARRRSMTNARIEVP